MRFLSAHYYRAALERVEQSRRLYSHGESYALSMYAAGVAVECMLRAFKLLRDPAFDERHDLQRLFKASGMLQLDAQILEKQGFSPYEIQEHYHQLQTALNEISLLWANDFRFASEARLRAHVRREFRHCKRL
jgi:HEPN domain-containing protein